MIVPNSGISSPDPTVTSALTGYKTTRATRDNPADIRLPVLTMTAAADMSPPPRQLNGRCLCGAVRYVVTDAFEYAAMCHCANCRRATGSAFKPFAGIAASALQVTQGADQLHRYGQQYGHDARCAACGSLLYSLVRDAAYVHVTLGTLTDTPTRQPTEHIFVGSKASWYTILDDLPQYEGHVGG